MIFLLPLFLLLFTPFTYAQKTTVLFNDTSLVYNIPSFDSKNYSFSEYVSYMKSLDYDAWTPNLCSTLNGGYAVSRMFLLYDATSVQLEFNATAITVWYWWYDYQTHGEVYIDGLHLTEQFINNYNANYKECTFNSMTFRNLGESTHTIRLASNLSNAAYAPVFMSFEFDQIQLEAPEDTNGNSTSSSGNNNNNGNGRNSEKSGTKDDTPSKIPIYAGIGGGVVLLIAIGVGLFFFCRRRKSKKDNRMSRMTIDGGSNFQRFHPLEGSNTWSDKQTTTPVVEYPPPPSPLITNVETVSSQASPSMTHYTSPTALSPPQSAHQHLHPQQQLYQQMQVPSVVEYNPKNQAFHRPMPPQAMYYPNAPSSDGHHIAPSMSASSRSDPTPSLVLTNSSNTSSNPYDEKRALRAALAARDAQAMQQQQPLPTSSSSSYYPGNPGVPDPFNAHHQYPPSPSVIQSPMTGPSSSSSADNMSPAQIAELVNRMMDQGMSQEEIRAILKKVTAPQDRAAVAPPAPAQTHAPVAPAVAADDDMAYSGEAPPSYSNI